MRSALVLLIPLLLSTVLSQHVASSMEAAGSGTSAAEEGLAGEGSPADGGQAGNFADDVCEKREATEYVWYASYGSNMWEDRFLCYIQGGKVEGMRRVCPGCRDRTPPVSSKWVAAQHRSWFGRTRTATWGTGGVAFLDPVPWTSRDPDGTPHLTLLRLYKITLQQFNDVVAQENMSPVAPVSSSNQEATPTPNSPPPSPSHKEPLVPLSLIQHLMHSPSASSNETSHLFTNGSSTLSTQGPVEPVSGGNVTSGVPEGLFSSAAPLPISVQHVLSPIHHPAFHEVIPGGWYGTVVLLGSLDASPILTFTCNAGDTDNFYRRKLPVNPPSPSYRLVVGRGLVGTGLTDKQAQEYMDERSVLL